ncbi:MAG: hypothetical protein ACRCTW_09705 [Lactococcus garvieae]
MIGDLRKGVTSVSIRANKGIDHGAVLEASVLLSGGNTPGPDDGNDADDDVPMTAASVMN